MDQIAKHPDNTYRSEYFMAIIRHTREEIAKRTHNEAFLTSQKKNYMRIRRPKYRELLSSQERLEKMIFFKC